MRFSKICAWLSSGSTGVDLLAHVQRLGVASCERDSGDYILRRYLEDRDAVASTLVSQLRENPSPSVRLGIIKLFCHFDSLDRMSASLDKKKRSSRWGPLTIVQHLHEANAQRDVDMLIGILEDRGIRLFGPGIQTRAEGLLANAGARAVQPLLRSMQKCFDLSSNTIVHAALLSSIAHVLSKIPREAWPILVQTINTSKDECLRFTAMWAICEVAERTEDKDLLPVISTLEAAIQRDPSPRIRKVATAFLDEYNNGG